MFQNTCSYRSSVAAITMLSSLLAAGCLITGMFAVNFNFEAFSNPVKVLEYSNNAHLARLFNLLDMFGYYLLLLPAIIFFHQQYKYKSPWVPLYTFSGLAYVLTGAIGAAILYAVWPGLMQLYLKAGSENYQSVVIQFQTITEAVTKGLWNTLQTFFAATWWIGIGSLLYKDKKWTAVLSILTGIACLADGLGNITGFNMLAEAGLNAYLILGIIWPFAIAVFILKGNNQTNLKTTEQKI